MKYEFLEHTADIKFRAHGKTMEEAFESAVLAVAEFIAKGNKVKARKKKEIEIEGTDKENLLYNFLEELIVLLDSEEFVVVRGKVKIEGNKLTGMLYGDSTKNYKGLDHIKAATYAEMFVGKKNGMWEVIAVMDV